MKVLLDACVWSGASAVLAAGGHDVQSVDDGPPAPGDEEVLQRAQREGRVLITLDKDFGELAIVRRLAHCGIVRLVGTAARNQGPAAVAALQRYGNDLIQGGIVTVEPGRVRVRYAEA